MMLESVIAPIENGFDNLKFGIKKTFNLFDPIFIFPYRGYAHKGKLVLTGRVLEKERVVHGQEQKDSFFHNIFRFYKRYESDEIPNVKLEFDYHGHVFTATTDDEGFFVINEDVDTEGKPYWDEISIKIIDSPIDLDGQEISAKGEIMVIQDKSHFGIISDVDDTILESHITSMWMKVKTLALNTAQSRLSFPGVSELYRGLIKETKESGYKNPLWFVSGSSWNLYDLLDKFCKDKNIPKAPFLLRELSINAKKFIKKDAISYKLGQLRPLLKFTDPLPFIFIGDSGQKDPEIYEKIVEEFPERVIAIYIRDVTPDKRDKQVKEIAKKMREKGVHMILAEDSYDAAENAFDNDWITRDALNKVEEAVSKHKKEEKTS